MSEREGGGNRMLERVAAILDAVEAGPASASDIARRTELSVSTVHRLALSMAELEFLRRDPDGRFRRGGRFVRSALENAALPILTALRDRTGETSQLWVRRGGDRLCLASVDSTHTLRATLPPGTRQPLPAGSAGRLLAAEDEALASVRERGWVESVGMRTPGLGSVSAPVTVRGELLGAVCVAVPLARVVGSPGEDFGPLTVEAAEHLAEVMETLRLS
ncbi:MULTISPECIES: IclR family transcriptional regulator [Citricoccus]|uniref:IclR family transcriptional regulator n=1 Tax=Citricoccus TaxID=169133 RepID=UPI000255F64B|nr:helix-turn-helix domain-containing protein [Citricoccus sp. CH26A]